MDKTLNKNNLSYSGLSNMSNFNSGESSNLLYKLNNSSKNITPIPQNNAISAKNLINNVKFSSKTKKNNGNYFFNF